MKEVEIKEAEKYPWFFTFRNGVSLPVWVGFAGISGALLGWWCTKFEEYGQTPWGPWDVVFSHAALFAVSAWVTKKAAGSALFRLSKLRAIERFKSWAFWIGFASILAVLLAISSGVFLLVRSGVLGQFSSLVRLLALPLEIILALWLAAEIEWRLRQKS